MRVIDFDGDPMLQLESFDNLNQYIFYLNQEAMDEINSYSIDVNENIPEFFSGLNPSFILLAEGGIDEEGKEFPDTYIGIETIQNPDYNYKIKGIYASDFQYKSPIKGEEILLKKNSKIMKK